MEKAREILSKYPIFSTTTDYHGATNLILDIAQALSDTRKEERERCAKVAEESYTVCSIGSSGNREPLENRNNPLFQKVPYSPKEIASAIRQGEKG